MVLNPDLLFVFEWRSANEGILSLEKESVIGYSGLEACLLDSFDGWPLPCLDLGGLPLGEVKEPAISSPPSSLSQRT